MIEVSRVPLDAISEPTIKLRPVNHTVVDELAKSIAGSGLLQPIMVRPSNGRYQLVFGLHRILACRSLGWTEIPAIIKEISTEEVVLLQIVENIQRNTAMSILEEGKAYKDMMRRGWTVSRISKAIGKSDSYVLDRVRVVDRLRPEIAKEATLHSHLTPSHATRIAYIHDHSQQLELANLVKTQKLSVRELERIIALYRSSGNTDVALTELVQRFKTFNLERWNEGVFPGPDGRVVVLRAETFNMIVDGLGERAYSVGVMCGRNAARRISLASRKIAMTKPKLLSLEKRIYEFNVRSGWGILSSEKGAVELRTPVLKNLEFMRGYVEGLLSLNLRPVMADEEKVVFRVVRPRAYDAPVGYPIYSI